MKTFHFYLLLLSLALPFCGFAQTVDTVQTDITQETFWFADKVHLLKGFIRVRDGATLFIEPSTVIKGDKASKGTLIVTRGSKIVADGTPTAPIVFTSNEPVPEAGDWGGLILLGNAPVNVLPELCFEPYPDSLYFYGGNDSNDDSGILRYVRVEYPGIAIQPNNELNGITFGGIGNHTIVDYVQVLYSGDDSFEWFGGTVNCKHLISQFCIDDDFDTDNGYSGKVQFALAVRDPQRADVSGSNGIESDNTSTGIGATPKNRATFSNVTVIGPSASAAVNGNYRRGMHLRRNTEAGIFNSIILGNWLDAGILIDGDSCANHAAMGRLEIKNTFVASFLPLKTNVAQFNVAGWFQTAGWGNRTFSSSNAVQLRDPFNLDSVNALLLPTSPAIGAASFVANRLSDPFFEQVHYVGAFDTVATSDWTEDWALFMYMIAPSTSASPELSDAQISSVQLVPMVASDHTQLKINLKESLDLTVSIYGMNGEFKGTQINQRAAAGEHTFGMNVSDLAAGIYFVQIQAGSAVTMEKLIVVR